MPDGLITHSPRIRTDQLDQKSLPAWKTAARNHFWQLIKLIA